MTTTTWTMAKAINAGLAAAPEGADVLAHQQDTAPSGASSG